MADKKPVEAKEEKQEAKPIRIGAIDKLLDDKGQYTKSRGVTPEVVEVINHYHKAGVPASTIAKGLIDAGVPNINAGKVRYVIKSK